MKIILVVGARPNFMKVGPVFFALQDIPGFEPLLIHTGQHYDENLSKVFFRELGFPEPDRYLGVGSGTHAEQTARVMLEFEKVLFEETPDLVMVAGDVNSTIACALDAAKLHIPVAHLEAGLRSFDMRMPEEINRMLTDAISHILLTPSKDANENLLREGIKEERIFFVGNAMIDSLRKYEKIADKSNILEELGVNPGSYGVITLHRPSNVDMKDNFERILSAFGIIEKELPLVFPIHPRAKKQIMNLGLMPTVESMKHLFLVDPLGYLDFLKLEKNAKIVFTDSGGIQEETTVLGVPCLTLRENTERPITIKSGTNELVGTNPDKIVESAERILAGQHKGGSIPQYWDGKTALRVVQVLKNFNERRK
jgi:UDP-N-acetylglucosamine 2-epimerase (non-hydrolysing)